MCRGILDLKGNTVMFLFFSLSIIAGFVAV